MKNSREKAKGMGLPTVVAGSVSAAALLAFSVQAQEGGPLATFDLFFDGEYRANDPQEDEYSLTTGLRFRLSSVTNAQSFGLSTDTRFILDEAGFDFRDPGLALDYARTNRSTAFDIGLNYGTREVEGAFEVIDPVTLDVTDLIDDDGTLQSLKLDAGLETGRDARFGTETRISYTDRTYTGTSDPDLTDLMSWQVGTTLRFDVAPRIGLRTSANHRVTEEDDDAQTESRTTRFGVGGNLLIDPLWSASLDLGYSLFETVQGAPGTRVTTDEDGFGAALSVSRRFRNGTLGLSLARDVLDIGAEDSLRISRSRELSNGGELAWSVGLVSFPNGETAPVVSFSYAMPSPRGGLSVGIAQTTGVNSDDESIVRTAIDFGFDQSINARSGWSLDGSLISISVAGEEEDDSSRAELGLAYNHALTEDWSLSASMRHRVLQQSGEEDRRASIFSLSLGRSFSFRP